MKLVNIYEAKTQLSRLLEQMNAGEEIVIAKAGHPIARLVPFTLVKSKRKPGVWKGKVEIAEDFDDLPNDLFSADKRFSDYQCPLILI